MRELTPSGQAAESSRLDAVEAAALRTRVQKAVGESYIIEGEVGRGGMAVVYAVRDVRLRRTVALKVLPPDLAFRADVRARFVREAQTAARLNHPNIVPIYAVDERDGMVFFAMALVEGESLATRLIRESKPSFDFVASVLTQVADALAYAHSASVVHRDIKPDNILIDRETGRATVTDFGIARAAESGARLTLTGIAVGTPAFMSPEQATGEREIDGRSDVYSLGIVGYLMLAGRLPFEASSTPAMLVKHVSERPFPLRQYRPDAPPELVAVIEKCLAKRPEDRWASAGAMRDAIREAHDASRAKSLGTGGNAVRPEHGSRGERAPSHVAPRAGDAPHLKATEPPARSDAEWRQSYALGKRAEDWAPPGGAPRGGVAPGVGPQGSTPNRPPVPPLVPMPQGTSSRDFKEWRRAVREQKSETRNRWREERNAIAESEGVSKGVANQMMMSPDEQISRFRWAGLRNLVLLGGLTAINAATSDFPWVIFPAFGIAMSMVGRYIRLRSNGIRLGDIVAGETAGKLAPGPDDSLTRPQQMEKAVKQWRRHAIWFAASTAVAVGSFAVGASLNADRMIIPFAAATVVAVWSFARAVSDRWRLRRLGLTIDDARSERWRAKAATADTRPREVRLREHAEQLVGTAVLASPMGNAVRAAVDDHTAIRDTSSRLSEADKAMVPEVDPTADALLERIAAIAGSLERLERDLPIDAMQDLDVRIASVEREADSAPDHDRRLSLLTRQRSSLQELVDRRDTLHRQFESATMALRSLRLDMVKLRTLGIGALNDVTNATQEARALSKDIARALYAADEMRKL